MALKIRLKRMGNKNRPFFRLVVQDSHWRRDGKTIADIGWYDPIPEPAKISFKIEEIFRWMDQGAQLSETVRSLLKKEGLLDHYKKGTHLTKPSSQEGKVTSPSAESGED